MNDDDPSDVAHEEFASAVLGAHPLGRPIGGTPDTIRAVPRDAVWEHYREHYRPETLVFAAAGGVDHDTVVAQVSEGLAVGGWSLSGAVIPSERRCVTLEAEEAGMLPEEAVQLTVHRAVEQGNVIIGSTGLSATDDRRWVMAVLNAVLGGGMSSRLFQEIREKRGLAYSTYCFTSGHGGIGTFGLYAGCAPGKIDEVEALLHGEFDRFAADGITDTELKRSIGQLSGGLVLGMEDSGARMSRLGKSEIVFGELVSLEESLERIRAVTATEVQALAQDLASRPRSTVRVGPFGE
jgi:predicted Zn-dependent peptidase